MNNERKEYLKKIRTKKIIIIISQISILIAFLLFWEVATKLELADPFFFSSPSRIIKLFIQTNKAELARHVSITLLECLIAFALSSLLGFFIAVALWWSDFLRKLLDPYIVIINSLPKVALGPLIIIWAGTGKKAIITMGVLICIIVTVINILNGFLNVDPDKIFLLKSMNATKWQIFIKLILPSTISDIISALKVNIGLAWVGTIMGEYLVSGAGLGYLIIYGGSVFNLDLVMMSTIILCFLAGLMYFILSFSEKLFIKYKK